MKIAYFREVEILTGPLSSSSQIGLDSRQASLFWSVLAFLFLLTFVIIGILIYYCCPGACACCCAPKALCCEGCW